MVSQGGLMEALFVGGLTAVGVSFGVFFWFLLARPETPLGGLLSGSLTDEGWYDVHPGLLRALQILAGMILFCIGFLIGFSLIFLTGTNW